MSSVIAEFQDKHWTSIIVIKKNEKELIRMCICVGKIFN